MGFEIFENLQGSIYITKKKVWETLGLDDELGVLCTPLVLW